MSEGDQAAWNLEWEDGVVKDQEFVDALKVSAEYADEACDAACKAVFEADLLEWKKEVYETCKADKEVSNVEKLMNSRKTLRNHVEKTTTLALRNSEQKLTLHKRTRLPLLNHSLPLLGEKTTNQQTVQAVECAVKP